MWLCGGALTSRVRLLAECQYYKLQLVAEHKDCDV